MFKRARWISFGALLGVAGSVWTQWKLRQTVQRYLPEQVAGRAGRRAQTLGADMVDALREGRSAMREREAELRAQIDGGREQRGGPSPVRPMLDATSGELRRGPQRR